MNRPLRDVYGDSLLKYGKDNRDVVVLDADVSTSTKSSVFGEVFPERFFNVGVAEANMVGIAAGLATTGKIPFVNTFAVFLTSLGLIGARTFGSYAKLNIKLIGAYGGLSDSYDGPTHHALEDIAVMRALPNFQVFVASDIYLTDWLVRNAIEVEGPMYVRLSRDSTETVHTTHTQFRAGKGIALKQGLDATIIACGTMVGHAMEAAGILAGENIDVGVIDMFTIKPLDQQLVIESAVKTGAIVTAEEHNIIGGLGGAVAEVLSASGVKSVHEFVGVNDLHTESGPYLQLREKYGLGTLSLVDKVKTAVQRKQG